MYNQGISYTGDILDLAIQGDIIQKMGSWFSYGDMKIGQGRENSKDFLADNEDVMKEVVTKVKSFMGLEESQPEKNGKS
jgi:recombination protein RecA